MYIFKISTKRQIFWYPSRPIQRKKVSISQKGQWTPLKIWKVKNGRNRSKFRKIFFYKQILDFHCLSKIVWHTSKLWNFVNITGLYCTRTCTFWESNKQLQDLPKSYLSQRLTSDIIFILGREENNDFFFTSSTVLHSHLKNHSLSISFLDNLKVPKHEIFLTELIILSYPIWIGDLGSTAKNWFVWNVRGIFAILFFYRLLSMR